MQRTTVPFFRPKKRYKSAVWAPEINSFKNLHNAHQNRTYRSRHRHRLLQCRALSSYQVRCSDESWDHQRTRRVSGHQGLKRGGWRSKLKQLGDEHGLGLGRGYDHWPHVGMALRRVGSLRYRQLSGDHRITVNRGYICSIRNALWRRRSSNFVSLKLCVIWCL